MVANIRWAPSKRESKRQLLFDPNSALIVVAASKYNLVLLSGGDLGRPAKTCWLYEYGFEKSFCMFIFIFRSWNTLTAQALCLSHHELILVQLHL